MNTTRARPRSARHTRRISRLIARDGDRCVWCHMQLSVSHPAATVDHLVPNKDSRSMRLSNLVLACSTCNHERGCLPVGDWVRRIARLDFDADLELVRCALHATASSDLPFARAAAAQLRAVQRTQHAILAAAVA